MDEQIFLIEEPCGVPDMNGQEGMGPRLSLGDWDGESGLKFGNCKAHQLRCYPPLGHKIPPHCGWLLPPDGHRDTISFCPVWVLST